jgi:inosine/xanthosine triphosphatase
LIIAVGSQNRIKVDAVRTSLKHINPEAIIKDVLVKTNIPSQPWGDDQIIHGAITRAKLALEIAKADLGIGLESGVIHNSFGYFTNAWCAICDSKGQISVGGGFSVELPPQVVDELKAGADLGQAMSRINTPHLHSSVGAIGVLTNNLLNRSKAYENIILCALTRYLRPDLYPRNGTLDGTT